MVQAILRKVTINTFLNIVDHVGPGVQHPLFLIDLKLPKKPEVLITFYQSNTSLTAAVLVHAMVVTLYQYINLRKENLGHTTHANPTLHVVPIQVKDFVNIQKILQLAQQLIHARPVQPSEKTV